MADDESRNSASLDARLRALKKEVRGAGEGVGDGGQGRREMGAGSKIAADFIAGIVVGALFGYGLDWWLGTTPWLLVTLLLLGFGAGVRSAYRTARKASEADDRPGD